MLRLFGGKVTTQIATKNMYTSADSKHEEDHAHALELEGTRENLKATAPKEMRAQVFEFRPVIFWLNVFAGFSGI